MYEPLDEGNEAHSFAALNKDALVLLVPCRLRGEPPLGVVLRKRRVECCEHLDGRREAKLAVALEPIELRDEV